MNSSNGYVTCSSEGLHLQLSLLVRVICMYDREGSWTLPKVHGNKGGVCGILSPICPELNLFTVRIKLWFRTSYLESFYDKAWYDHDDRVMMVLELLPIEA